LDYSEVSGHPIRSMSSGLEPRYAIGVGVTTDRLVGVLLDLDGRLVRLGSSDEFETQGRLSLRVDLDSADVETVVAAVADLARDVFGARPDLWDEVLGLGVSIGGHVDGEAGVVRFSPELGWSGDVQLAELLKQATGFEVVTVENDVNVLVDAEQWSETARRFQRFAVVKIGTGIGCGLSLHQELERGATGAAGELGHVPFERDGRGCVCGKRGCLQTVAGGDAILQTIRDRGDRDIAGIDRAADLARGGHRLAQAAFEEAGEALGIGLAILLNLVNLEAVVLCGDAGLLKYDPYIEAARRSLDTHAFSTTAEDCALLVEARTDELEARGAASMALGRLVDIRGDHPSE
jgi:predicted NBD/HSP70 family sugar kinase